LVDFGLAKMTESALKFSATSTVKGTHRWMVSQPAFTIQAHSFDLVQAPELMNPDEKSKAFVTFATDIYSMGMVCVSISRVLGLIN
jgi:serine/threonine protein kinase